MSSRKYKVGRNRHQVELLPPSLEEFVSSTKVVQAKDTYVDSLNLLKLGFSNTEDKEWRGSTSISTFNAIEMLLIWLHEQNTLVNVELMWLLKDLKPSHATIANFRKENLKAIKAVNQDLVQMCREMGLYGGEEVGIDWTFMHGNASKASIHTQANFKPSRYSENGKIQFKYVSKANTCKDCKLKQQCLPQKTPHKSLYRWEHQSVIDKHRTRMGIDGRKHMKNRSGMVEHPFGIMKIQMGWLPFLMRGD